MNVFIAGITSDIAFYCANRFLERGDVVSGTYRSFNDYTFQEKVNKSGGDLFFCDFSDFESINHCVEEVLGTGTHWDVFISAVGIIEPVEDFVRVNMDLWEKNLRVNAIAQIKFLHELLPFRNNNASVFFMTSKGVNDSFSRHSAYCLSKILLIKLCELLDDEIGDCKFVAFNPGFIETKIIKQEPGRYVSAEGEGGCCEASLERVWEFLCWAIRIPKQIVSGRSFFVKYDKWKSSSFCDFLTEFNDAYKLRRFMDEWVREKGKE